MNMIDVQLSDISNFVRQLNCRKYATEATLKAGENRTHGTHGECLISWGPFY